MEKYNKRHSALYKAAVIILMFCAVGTVTVYNADANKLKFITQLFKSDDKSIDISTKENILDYDIDELPDGWDYIYLPQYVPAGYKVDEIEVYSNSVDIVYYCGDNYVLFSQCKEINTNESVDNERHSIEKIKIDNYEAYLFLGENDSILSWNNENYSFTISGNLNNEEIIAFAESLEKY